MKRVMVVLNKEHKLFPEQIELLNSKFRKQSLLVQARTGKYDPLEWDILTVPPEGWDLEAISDLVVSIRKNGCYHIVFASPVPALMAKLANSWDEERPLVWAFHNDQRISKEVPDGKGGVRLIKTVSPDGWQLIC